MLALAGVGGAADLPRRGQRVVDRRPAGDQGDRLAGRQGVRDAGRAGPGERRAGAPAHVGDGVGADDRRGAGQRGGGVRLVAALDVLRTSWRTRVQGRLHRHRRLVPGPAAGGRRRRSPRCPSCRRSPPCAAPRRSSTATRRRSAPSTRWPSSSSSTSTCVDGSFQAMADGGIMVHKDPAKDLDLRRRRRGRADVPERRRGDPAGRRHLRGRLAGRQLADLARHARAGAADAVVPGLLRRRPSWPRGSRRSRADAAIDGGDGRRSRRPRCRPTPSSARARRARSTSCCVIITVLLAFAILIAVLGISITLALGVFERTREIGLMRAVGMNKRQTRRIGALGGDHRLDVRGHRRHRRRHADRRSPCRWPCPTP